MKIMIGTDTYPPTVSGAGRFTQRLAEGLARRGHEVHVVCPSATGPATVQHERGVTIHRLKSHRCPVHDQLRICLPWEADPDTARLVEAVRPDVIHVQSHLVVGRGLTEAAGRTRTPLVATNHFMPENVVGYLPVPTGIRRAIAGWSWSDLGRVFAEAQVITAPTPRAVELLERSTGLSGVVAVSCGIDPMAYARATASAGTDDVPTILFVGRLDEEKRVDELIRAVAALPPQMPAQLEIIGDGKQRSTWTQLARRLRLADRVRFRGFVSEDELLAAYGRCAVFCMPGVAELQSLVTLEAMAAGKPVVAADAMALPHLVRPGRNGWLFRPGDIEELSAQLYTLVADPMLRTRMGRYSRRLVAQHSDAATLEAFEDIYLRVRRGAPRDPVASGQIRYRFDTHAA